MLIMKKYIVLAAALCAAGVAQAQNQSQAPGELNRQMEVTRAYEPTVNTATKLGINPNLTDTVALRPEFNYAIEANPVTQNSTLEPIRAASINTTMQENLLPFYLKVGLGYPLQSLLDFYYNAPYRTNGRLGAYINHYGSWSKIENNYGVKAPASETNNRIGAFGEHRFGRMNRYMVGGELYYNYQQVSNYGYYTYEDQPIPETFDTSAEGLRQHFSTVGANVVVGNPFEDLEYFNFRVGLDFEHFNDRFDNKQNNISGFAEIGKRFRGKNDLTVKLAYEHITNGETRSTSGDGRLEYRDNSFTVGPRYRFGGSKWKFLIGLDYVYNEENREAYHYLFPQVGIVADIANGHFTPYLEIDGSLQNNSYSSLVAQNPYVMSGLNFHNAAYNNARLGFKGSIASSFSYNIYGGASIVNDMNFFVNNGLPGNYYNTFGLLSDNTFIMTVGGELEGRISGAFSIGATFQYLHYDLDHLDIASGMPNIKAGLGLKYNVNRKLQLNAGVRIEGERTWYEVGPSLLNATDLESLFTTTRINPTYDIYLGANYQISRLLGVFLNANNLANQQLYPYNGYAGLGINVMAGVKLTF